MPKRHLQPLNPFVDCMFWTKKPTGFRQKPSGSSSNTPEPGIEPGIQACCQVQGSFSPCVSPVETMAPGEMGISSVYSMAHWLQWLFCVWSLFIVHHVETHTHTHIYIYIFYIHTIIYIWHTHTHIYIYIYIHIICWTYILRLLPKWKGQNPSGWLSMTLIINKSQVPACFEQTISDPLMACWKSIELPSDANNSPKPTALTKTIFNWTMMAHQKIYRTTVYNYEQLWTTMVHEHGV